MNAVSIILLILIIAAVMLAFVRIMKNKGKCPGCSGDCGHCMKKI